MQTCTSLRFKSKRHMLSSSASQNKRARKKKSPLVWQFYVHRWEKKTAEMPHRSRTCAHFGPRGSMKHKLLHAGNPQRGNLPLHGWHKLLVFPPHPPPPTRPSSTRRYIPRTEKSVEGRAVSMTTRGFLVLIAQPSSAEPRSAGTPEGFIVRRALA